MNEKAVFGDGLNMDEEILEIVEDEDNLELDDDDDVDLIDDQEDQYEEDYSDIADFDED